MRHYPGENLGNQTPKRRARAHPYERIGLLQVMAALCRAHISDRLP